MRFLSFLAIAFILTFAGCTKSGPVLSPIQDAGCAIETAVSGGIAGAVSSALQCSHPDVVAQQLQAAFGNANLCSAPIPVPPVAPQASSVWHKIGDVPASALESAKGMKDQVKAQGVIGNIACPISINAAIGFLSNSVPSAWGCSGPNATISGLVSALTSACEAAVPL